MNERKGISLIVLVITILVMIILAGVVVVSLQKNNPIEKAKTAKDINNLSSIKEELELYKTNELSNGNKDANVISFTKEETKANLKSIPDNLKDKAIVSDGKLGVYYSVITEEAREYARKNDIFNAEDTIAPDVDVYLETVTGKKYVRVDAVDYEIDIAKIVCSNGKEKIPNLDYEKIVVLCDHSVDKIFTRFLKTQFKNVDLAKNPRDDISKYNVVVGFGAQFSCNAYEYNNDIQDIYTNSFNASSKDKPVYVVTAGNDTIFHRDKPHIFDSFIANNTKEVNFIANDSIDDIISRKLKETKKCPNYYADNTRYGFKFKEDANLTRYYTNTLLASHSDCIGMYLDRENDKGWFHMQECGDYSTKEKIELTAQIYKAAITKMTGSRSMEIDVTGVASGTKYTFTVTDLAGNEITKEITL